MACLYLAFTEGILIDPHLTEMYLLLFQGGMTDHGEAGWLCPKFPFNYQIAPGATKIFN